MMQEETDIKKQVTEKKTALSLSIREKQFRFSDWFAGKLIKTVAFFSIAFVILIFLFVFRETLPLFDLKKGQEKSEAVEESGALRPETYVGEDQAAGELRPEVYMSDEAIEEAGELRPETYGDVPPILSYSDDTEYGSYSIGEEADEPVKTLFSKDWQPISDRPRYGLLPLFIGTLKVTLLSILFAAPLAIMAALYTAMFASPRMKEIIKPAIELLAGFPSVVIGFFALMVLASFFQQIFGYASRLNAFVGAIAMGLAAIPIIYTLTEDALTAVPKTYIEASLGLGASMRQTAFSVILPAATPGIFAAVILGIGRVFGETMIALMATGNAALISLSPFDSVRTFSATIGTEMAEVVFGDTHYSVLFLIGSLLFIFTFTLNAVAEFYFKNKVVKRIQGK